MSEEETSEETPKAHTPFVVGGRYCQALFIDAKTGKPGEYMYGILTGAKRHAGTGRLEGMIRTYTRGDILVHYGETDLDIWTLEAEPVPPEVLSGHEARIRELETQVKALLASAGRTEPPATADADLTAMSARGKRISTNGAAGVAR